MNSTKRSALDVVDKYARRVAAKSSEAREQQGDEWIAAARAKHGLDWVNQDSFVAVSAADMVLGQPADGRTTRA